MYDICMYVCVYNTSETTSRFSGEQVALDAAHDIDSSPHITQTRAGTYYSYRIKLSKSRTNNINNTNSSNTLTEKPGLDLRQQLRIAKK